MWLVLLGCTLACITALSYQLSVDPSSHHHRPDMCCIIFLHPVVCVSVPLQVRGKAMGHNSGDLFELMGDILATARLDDRARFTQMVAETKANMEAGIIGSGHR
jgi:Zn-dependent M16 (insulinase) family peptidase